MIPDVCFKGGTKWDEHLQGPLYTRADTLICLLTELIDSAQDNTLERK